MQLIRISLVITVLNEIRTIQVLLDGLRKQSILPDETIIIDGGSNDGTFGWLQENISKYRVLNLSILEVNGNRSLGRNVGIAAAKNTWIAITDAGCIPHHDWLENLKRSATEYQLNTKDPKEVVIAGYYDAKPASPLEEAIVPYVLVMSDRVDAQTFLPATRSMLLQKSVWQKLGGFDVKLSDNEDYDFARRIQALGSEKVVIVFSKAAKVTWMPRTTVKAFGQMIFRFARGDAQAGLWRLKVGLVFARYLIGLLVVFVLLFLSQWQMMILLLVLGGSIYSLWSICKNYRYVPNGWYWLPILQIVADFGVMSGTTVGFIKRVSNSLN